MPPPPWFLEPKKSLVSIGLKQKIKALRPKMTKIASNDPLEAILVIFGRRALIFFCLKALEKNEE